VRRFARVRGTKEEQKRPRRELRRDQGVVEVRQGGALRSALRASHTLSIGIGCEKFRNDGEERPVRLWTVGGIDMLGPDLWGGSG
jgi:hypothetical protein